MNARTRDGGHADLLSTWHRSAWGADDHEAWRAQLAARRCARSPLGPIVGQLARSDREQG